METLINAYAANGDDDWINRLKKEAIQAILDWVQAETGGNIPQVEIDLRGLYASFIEYYLEHQETYK